MSKRKKVYNHGHKVLIGILCLLAISIWQSVDHITLNAQNKVFTPQIPKANRNQKNKVFLEHADKLKMDERVSTDYQVLVGNVKFRKEGMFMYCDSAYFYEKTNSLDAFGNVKMEQGDTLFVYADVLYYSGIEELARLRYNVRMENRDVTLITDSLDYDMVANLGYFFDGGKIVDSENELSSVYGQYEPDTKNAEFLFDVELFNPKYVMNTDTLLYNTNTHIADIVGYTTIVSDSNIIYSDKGWYNTSAETASLYNRSLIVGKDGQRLTGDTIFYNRNTGLGEVFSNMILTDSVNNTILQGNYGFHNEKSKVSFATKNPYAMQYSQGDTLYLRGDTIRTYLFEDSSRVLTAYPRVRFFREDVQGLADSLSFTARDSMLYMYKHPIVWNENKQVMGNEINVHMNDSTADWAKLPNYGIMAEMIEHPYYNQLSGKEMLAVFENGKMKRLDVNGNVQSIFYPQENDSTYNKLVSSESSFLKVDFKEQNIEKLKMWPEVTGKAIPLYLAKQSEMILPGFVWYSSLRPMKKEDIFVYPEGMAALLSTPEKTSAVKKHVKKISTPMTGNKKTEAENKKDITQPIEPKDVQSDSVDSKANIEEIKK